MKSFIEEYSPQVGAKNMFSCYFVVSSRISLVKGERYVRLGVTTADILLKKKTNMVFFGKPTIYII